MRDVLRLSHDPSIGNQPYPECCLAYLEVVREEYGIDEDRDRDVYQTLKEHARQADLNHWRRDDRSRRLQLSRQMRPGRKWWGEGGRVSRPFPPKPPV